MALNVYYFYNNKNNNMWEGTDHTCINWEKIKLTLEHT